MTLIEKQRFLPFLRGLFFQFFACFIYFYLQLALVGVLNPTLFALYSSLSSLGLIMGHLSSLGSDGRLYSELISTPSFRLRIQDFFSYIPSAIFFSLLVSFFLQYLFVSSSDILFANILFLCSIIFLQPLLSNIIAISSAKFLFLQVDFVTLSPSIARLIVVLYLYYFQNWSQIGNDKFSIFIYSITCAYILFSALSLVYSYRSITRVDEPSSSSTFIPRSFIIRRQEVPNYLIFTISSLAPYGLLLPLVLYFSYKIHLDIAPSLALAITFITFLVSISQQYWMRLKMNRFNQYLGELGLSFFNTSFFKRSIAYIVLLQLIVSVSLYCLAPSILSTLNLDGYDHFRLCVFSLIPFLVLTSASIPFSLLFGRVDLVVLRTRFCLVAASLSLTFEILCVYLGLIPLACLALSLYPGTLLFFFVNNRSCLFRLKSPV